MSGEVRGASSPQGPETGLVSGEELSASAVLPQELTRGLPPLPARWGGPEYLLRQAAARLREVAGRASAGPWDAGSDGLVWPPRMGDPVSGSTEREDAEYIALMHPPVALALADLLERAAADPNEVDNDLWADFEHLARQILREDFDG